MRRGKFRYANPLSLRLGHMLNRCIVVAGEDDARAWHKSAITLRVGAE